MTGQEYIEQLKSQFKLEFALVEAASVVESLDNQGAAYLREIDALREKVDALTAEAKEAQEKCQ